jgi:hypothetical protein
MAINHLSVSVSGFGVCFSPVHTTLVVASGCFGMFQEGFRGRRLMTMIFFRIANEIYRVVSE